MSRVRGKNSKPELAVRSMLHKAGFRFRLHKKELPGTPDIVLPKYKTTIFIHGCFWHRHCKCRRGRSVPNSNKEYWNSKFKRTIERDKENIKFLLASNWKVIVIWECEIMNKEKLMRQLKRELYVCD